MYTEEFNQLLQEYERAEDKLFSLREEIRNHDNTHDVLLAAVVGVGTFCKTHSILMSLGVFFVLNVVFNYISLRPSEKKEREAKAQFDDLCTERDRLALEKKIYLDPRDPNAKLAWQVAFDRKQKKEQREKKTKKEEESPIPFLLFILFIFIGLYLST